MVTSAVGIDSAEHDWLADATRRLAGVPDAPAVAARQVHVRDEAAARVRESVMRRVRSLPRRSRPLSTAKPQITVSELALSRALGAALERDAAGEAVVVADVSMHADDTALRGVHIHLVAVETDDRPLRLFDDGERMRERAADLVRRIAGSQDVRVDVTWDDLLLRSS